ncbi:serine carboxypeptidase-like 34 [Miscanthus floridulus]|uniref:serine carboxypeptidase-like 34 n=1 Tax=Miscanthus floridulus TaxID=154761 RepID=UPI00345AF4B4
MNGGEKTVFERQEADRVEALPGQPSEVGFRHFSGYVTVNQTHARALFYWFMDDAHKKPVVLWLNGGPGCSSLGTGAIEELGPFLIQNPGTNRHELRLNPESWNKEANLLFLESPAGVGFSYTNTTSDLHKFGDKLTAHDAYTFLVEWFKRFPQFKGHDFCITGESYAGILARTPGARSSGLYLVSIACICFMIGNAAIDDASDDRGMVEYAWDHVISDELHDAIATHCDFSRNDAGSDFSSDAAASQQSDACDRAMDAFYEAFDDIDIYSLYAPVCTATTNSSSSSSSSGGGQHRPSY